jgi:hypothetical protein
LVYSDEFGRFRDGNNCPSKKIDIEDMFRDFKAGGYSLEGSQLATQYLSKLIIVIAIAYTSATMQGKKIKDMGIQKYVMSQDLKKDIKVNADTAVFMWVNISIIGYSYIKYSKKI